MSEACPGCASKNTIEGDCLAAHTIVGAASPSTATRFEPDDLRWFQFRLSRGIPLQGRFCVCPSCGLVWSAVSVEELRRLIEAHGTPEAKSKLFS